MRLRGFDLGAAMVKRVRLHAPESAPATPDELVPWDMQRPTGAAGDRAVHNQIGEDA